MKRTQVMSIRLTPGERAELERLAAKTHRTLADYVRLASLGVLIGAKLEYERVEIEKEVKTNDGRSSNPARVP